MANNLVYSWADKSWQMNPPRKYIATRYAQAKEKPNPHSSTFNFTFTIKKYYKNKYLSQIFITFGTNK